jgi:CheY-like chemotaxis protein
VSGLEVFDRSNTLKVLIVDSESLHGHVCDLLELSEDAVSVVGHDAAICRLSQGPFDVVLLAVGESVVSTLVTAAKMRSAERQVPTLHHAAIIACTSDLGDFDDCASAGSGLSGALNAPWSRAKVHACLDRWRAGKYLRELCSERPAS